MMVNRIIPDFKFTGNESEASIEVKLKGRNFPLEDASDLSTATVTSSTTQSFVRARAREQIVRIESSGEGYGWSLGDLRLGIRTDGRR